MATWDPTDGAGWKRAIASSTSPTTLEPPAKKAKMSSFFVPKKYPLLPDPSADGLPATASARHSLADGDTASVSSEFVEDVTDESLPLTSRSYPHPSPFPPGAAAPMPIPVERLLPSLTYITPPARPGFLFGNTNDHRDLRTHSSEYFDKIQNNAYTSALLPSEQSPNIPLPRNGAEARDLLKRGRYNKPKPEVLVPTIHELEKALEDLRRRHAKLKAVSTSAGIEISSNIWEETNTMIEQERPDFNKMVDEDGCGELDTLEASSTQHSKLTTVLDLKYFTAQLEKWDKAVGHKAILMKRMFYKQQIAELENKIEKMRLADAASAERDLGEADADQFAKEKAEEWKGHRTGFGRRFKGLIEKE